MFIALTGTPGTGKTSIAERLRSEGFTVVDIQRLAIDKNITEGMDSERNSIILDPDLMEKMVSERYHKTDDIIFESHLSHLLPSMDKVIVLRCRPDVLKDRLAKKDWLKKKILENLEAEIIDVVLCEAVEEHGKNIVFELDTTMLSVEECATIIKDLISSGFSMNERFRVGQIDWSEFALNDFLKEI